MPVTVGCFSEDSQMWAFATGEDWSLGGCMAEQKPNIVSLYLRKCDKEDVYKQPKNK